MTLGVGIFRRAEKRDLRERVADFPAIVMSMQPPSTDEVQSHFTIEPDFCRD